MAATHRRGHRQSLCCDVFNRGFPRRDADIAAFITNVKGDVSDPTFNGLWIAPVTLIN